MKNLGLVVSSLFLVGLLLLACAPKAAPSAAPAAPAAPAPQVAPSAPAVPAPARAAWEEGWERTLNAAKKEGRVVVIGTPGGALVRRALSEGFKRRYGIAVEAIEGRGAEIVEKLFSERRAGIYSADVYIGGSTTILTQLIPAGVFEPLEPAFILPEVLDPKVWWRGELDWVEKDHLALAFLASPNIPLAINTELVKPGEIKSYRDLLDPKWKGKILFNDPRVSGTGAKVFGVVADQMLGLDYWRELAKQSPTIVRDERQCVDWLARGKFPVLIGPHMASMTEFIAIGAKVDFIMPQEGGYISSGYGNLSLIKNAPHPNASKVFINWLLTPEGQRLFSEGVGIQSGRVDVPTDYLHPLKLRQPGVKYFDAYREAFVPKQAEHMKLAKEIFGP